ncbi:MAG: hypothetical protein MUE85_21525 [Microscillaceae bacterium]|jgi:hypothetical protein|nr:hypothetical protein [Microscillaceae bacterium]
MKKIVIIGLFALGAIGGLTYCTFGGGNNPTTEQTDKDPEKDAKPTDEGNKTQADSTQKDSAEVKADDKKVAADKKEVEKPTDSKDEKKVEKK